jgi:deoxyribodipyrimidine photo-lyase
MRTAIALFTRDLRVADNPMLRAALDRAERVLPLFVHDDRIAATRFGGSAPRRAFLDDALADLDMSLRRLGGALVIRRGDVVAECARAARQVRADTVFVTADVGSYAQRREERLARVVDLRLVDGHFAVAPGHVAPAGSAHYTVFTPYQRAWSAVPPGRPLATPRRLRLPEGMAPPALAPAAGAGGEREGRRRMLRWLRSVADRYAETRDRPAADGTSRLSPYLHFGCVSARELVTRAAARGAEAFLRQLCWRDFFAQLLWARPETQRDDMRPRGDRWVDDPDALDAWKAGQTGYPLVDAGMRQLAAEGWMHNRARLVTASFLVKHLGIDWREGAGHFFDLLLDGDVAQNVGNWQWVAGTGADTRPNRMFNPTAQARRVDAEGAYIRRWVAELVDVPDALSPGPRASGYPAPIVGHRDAVAGFRARRAAWHR